MRAYARAVSRAPEKVLSQQLRLMPDVDREILARPLNASIRIKDLREAFRQGGAAAGLEARLHVEDWGFGLEDLEPWIAYGGSPRAAIFLTKAAKARAFLNGRGYVVPDDVKAIARDVLRHRLLLTYEAEAEEVDPDSVLDRLLEHLDVP
jgi:MoxR-like ATPase